MHINIIRGCRNITAVRSAVYNYHGVPMSRYAVWSTVVGPRPEKGSKEPPVPARDQLETTRTDRRVAEEDAALIKSCFHRKTWIQEIES